MKVLRTNLRTNESEDFEISQKAISKYGERMAFAMFIFFYQPGCSSFSEWINGLERGIDNVMNSERMKDICYSITSSDGVFSYTNENYSWVGMNESNK